MTVGVTVCVMKMKTLTRIVVVNMILISITTSIVTQVHLSLSIGSPTFSRRSRETDLQQNTVINCKSRFFPFTTM
jgi:hypothetical protein